jgi:hypothetical protein
MPGKSKHSRGKRPQNRNRVRQPAAQSTANAAGTGAPAAAIPAAPVAAGTSSAPPRATKGATARVTSKNIAYSAATVEQYPFFTRELKRIAVITGILLIILITLGLVLR